MLRLYGPLGTPQKALLQTVMDRLNFSARAYDRILRVARTLADMADSPNIEAPHISEAVGYRALDRSAQG